MKNISFDTNARPWKEPTGDTRALRAVAYVHAMQHEPTPAFPGVDIDAIHYKLGAVKIKEAA